MKPQTSAEYRIDIALEESGCTVIVAQSKYTTDEFGVGRATIPWNPDNITKLEKTISERMIANYQKEISENLEKKLPIFYIDCQQKGEDDIMLYILKEFVRKLEFENKELFLSKLFGMRTLVVDQQEWNEYIKQSNPSVEEIFLRYTELLNKLIQGKPDFTEDLLDSECDIAFDGIAESMKLGALSRAYVYLDNVGNLSWNEQRRICMILYTRGKVGRSDQRIRLKINNGAKQRKSWTTYSKHRVESSHDFSETGIPEIDL